MTAIRDDEARQLELQSLGEPPWLQEWLPDETLYSFISRHHFWTGSTRAADTCRRFFGHPTEGSSHDFPARIDTFVRRTRGHVGSPIQVIQQRTLLHYYLAFRDHEARRIEVARARSQGLGDVKARLGLLAGRLGATHPLKLCMSCMAEELTILGVSYWHRDHQIPTVWICDVHNTTLKISKWRHDRTQRFQWGLPHHSDVLPVEYDEANHPKARLSRLAELTRKAMTSTQNVPWRPEPIGRFLAARLLGLRSTTSCRGLSLGVVRDLVSPLLKALAQSSGNESLTTTGAVNRAFRSLTQPSQAHTPFWLLLIATAVSLTPSDLETAATTRPALPPPTSSDPVTDHRKTQLMELLAKGASFTQSATTVGIATGTAIAWASRVGISVSSLHAKPVNPKRVLLESALLRGMNQKDAAVFADLSRSTVTQILRTSPELRQKWMDKCQSDMRRAKRNEWVVNLRKHSSLGATSIRHLLPSTYSWLFKHDRSWLLEINAQHFRRRKERAQHKVVDVKNQVQHDLFYALPDKKGG